MDAPERTCRNEADFGWAASCGMPAYAQLAGVRYDLVFHDAEAIIKAYTRGRPAAEELFGPDVAMSGPLWAGNSYGHANALGSRLIFPEDSEVAHTPIYGSLAEGIRALKIDVDFTAQGLFPHFLDLWQELKRAFPGERISFGDYKAEGPLTTGWILRGHDFFTDILDEPEMAKEYLNEVVGSIVRYNKTIRRINRQPEFSADGAGLADDVSAMIAPARWPELVVPFIERYYSEQTSGARSAHIEDLRVEHLKYLDVLRLTSYDPSVSPRLTPALIRDNCGVSFVWKLNNTQYPALSESDIEGWVFRAAAEGASGVWTGVSRDMCNPECAAKVRAFIRAAKRVQALVQSGCPRGELVGRM